MRRRTAGLVAMALTSVVTAAGGHLATAASRTSPSPEPPERRPNIVLVLMDDFSLELLATMPQARLMQAQGATYRNAHVVDSLCCPSRAAIFTGRPPHQTHVLTNTTDGSPRPLGGYLAFEHHDNAEKAFNVALQRSGYTTAFIGKYMNGYDMTTDDRGRHVPPPKVPGWDVLEAVLGGGYRGWGFWSTYLDERGRMSLRHTRMPDRTAPVAELDRGYATNVMADRAVDFLRSRRGSTEPFFLEVAPYGPHAQMRRAYPDNPTFPSAFADRAPADDPTGGNCGTTSCGRLTLRDLVGYGDPRSDNRPTYLRADGTTAPAPAWNTNPVTLTDEGALTRYRDRARTVQAIDRMISRLRAEAGPDTYFFLTSDNGFHLGQHQLDGGKGSPYDSDTHVPLVVVGPRVRPGPRDQWVSSLDLASTFEELADLRPASYRSGTSFAASLHEPHAAGEQFVFMEHAYAPVRAGEVDGDRSSGGNIAAMPAYIAVRGPHGLLARFDLDDSPVRADYAWELYRYDVPWEDRNVFATDHDQPWARELMDRLAAWEDCTPAECRAARR